MIVYQTGDLFLSDCQALVNPVNCEGVMGAGLALVFREKFPEMFRYYRSVCLGEKGLNPGEILPWVVKGFRPVVNLATKDQYQNKSSIVWVRNGLKNLLNWCMENKIESVAVPAIGCGLGGLSFDRVNDEIVKVLGDSDWIRFEVYPPKDWKGDRAGVKGKKAKELEKKASDKERKEKEREKSKGAKILCSPAEPELYRAATGGRISSLCEGLGLDFLWIDGNGAMAGVQRKRFPDDFLASLHDNRLGKELLQIEQARVSHDLDRVVLVFEGRAQWSGNGDSAVLLHPGSKYTGQEMNRKGFERLCWRLQHKNGVMIDWCGSGAEEFGRWVKNFYDWSMKGDGVGDGIDGTRGRGGFFQGGKVSEKEMKKRWRSWVLQGIPKIGPGMAERLLIADPAPLVFSEKVRDNLEKIVGKSLGEELRKLLYD